MYKKIFFVLCLCGSLAFLTTYDNGSPMKDLKQISRYYLRRLLSLELPKGSEPNAKLGPLDPADQGNQNNPPTLSVEWSSYTKANFRVFEITFEENFRFQHDDEVKLWFYDSNATHVLTKDYFPGRDTLFL